MITTDECEARIWNDEKLIAEALNDSDHLHWSLKQIKQDTDPMSRNERAWKAIESAVWDRAGVMADEMNAEARAEQSEYEADAAHESRLMDQDNARAVNAGRY